MKGIKRVLSIICVWAMLITGERVMRWLVIDDTMNFSRLAMHDLYNVEENIDILFVGSSHSRRSFNPAVFDERLGVFSFNAGTTSQKMDGSYAVIKEAIQDNKIEHIYLECYYRMAVTPANAERDASEMSRVYDISDYMEPSIRKLDFLLKASGKEHYVNSFVVARRKWEKVFDVKYVTDLWNKKKDSSYWTYKPIYNESTGTYYVERGYATNDRELSADDFWYEEAYGEISVEDIPEDWENSLQDIIKLCDKENIELTLVVAPLPQETIAGKGNYDEYVSVVRKIADEAEISYWDFNLCRSEYFSCLDKSYFADDNHLNAKGSKAISSIFADLIAGNLTEEEIFHSSYEEKMSMAKPCLYGFAGPVTKGNVRHMQIISNRLDGMEYRIVLTSEDGAERVIQEYSSNKLFEVPLNEHGLITVTAISEENTELQVLEADY